MSNEMHVMPTGDLIEHRSNDDCPCVPRTEPVKRADGSVGWVVVHRDAIERAVVLSIEEWERKYYPTKDGDA